MFIVLAHAARRRSNLFEFEPSCHAALQVQTSARRRTNTVLGSVRFKSSPGLSIRQLCMDVWTNGCMDVSIYGCMDVWMYGCMDAWTYGCMDVWMYGCMDVRMYGCMYGCMDAWMYGCMDVWMYGCMDVWMHGCMHVNPCMLVLAKRVC